MRLERHEAREPLSGVPRPCVQIQRDLPEFRLHAGPPHGGPGQQVPQHRIVGQGAVLHVAPAVRHGVHRELEGAVRDAEVDGGDERLERREDPEDQRVRVGPHWHGTEDRVRGHPHSGQAGRVGLRGAHPQRIPVLEGLHSWCAAGDEGVEDRVLPAVLALELPEDPEAGPHG